MMPTGDVWRMWVAALLMFAAVMAVFAGLNSCAFGHDYKRPDLDGWYGSLKRPGTYGTAWGSTSCCSKKDCHTTEAELRGADWWARIGVPRDNGDWDLRDWVKVPEHVVLQQHDNPTGEGVICHSLAWNMSLPGEKQTLNAKAVTIFCFIPPTES